MIYFIFSELKTKLKILFLYMKDLVQHIQEKLKVSSNNPEVKTEGDKHVICEINTYKRLVDNNSEQLLILLNTIFDIPKLLNAKSIYPDIFKLYPDNTYEDIFNNKKATEIVELIVSILFSEETLNAGIENLRMYCKHETKYLLVVKAYQTYCFLRYDDDKFLWVEYDYRR